MTDLTETIRRVLESAEHERSGFYEPGSGGGPWRDNRSIERRRREQYDLYRTAAPPPRLRMRPPASRER